MTATSDSISSASSDSLLFLPSDGATLRPSLAACTRGGAVDAENGSDEENITPHFQKSGKLDYYFVNVKTP